MASQSGITGVPGQANYCAAKGAHIGNQDTVAGGRTERCYCKCYCPRVHPYGNDLQPGRVGAL